MCHLKEPGKQISLPAGADFDRGYELVYTAVCPARVPIGREYQMAVSTRCINNFHTSGILDTVGGTKFSL